MRDLITEEKQNLYWKITHGKRLLNLLEIYYLKFLRQNKGFRARDVKEKNHLILTIPNQGENIELFIEPKIEILGIWFDNQIKEKSNLKWGSLD